MKKEEILEECKELIEDICVKFNYDAKDIEGNDSLKTVLLKAITIMLEDSNLEDGSISLIEKIKKFELYKGKPLVLQFQATDISENITIIWV